MHVGGLGDYIVVLEAFSPAVLDDIQALQLRRRSYVVYTWYFHPCILLFDY